MKKKYVILISHSVIDTDSRVLRQLQEVLKHWDVIVFGMGDRVSITEGDMGRVIEYHKIPASKNSIIRWTIRRVGVLLSMIYPRFALIWMSFYKPVSVPASICQYYEPIFIIANELLGLEVAIRGRCSKDIAIIFDAHEYYPDDKCGIWKKFLHGRMSKIFLKSRLKYTTIRTTVCSPIANRYYKEFGFDFEVIRNIPNKTMPLNFKHNSNVNFRLIHHGVAARARCVEKMIQAIALSNERWSLDLMLIGDQRYIEELRLLAQQISSGRVKIIPSIRPDQIVEKLVHYDALFCFIEPTSYNYYVCLPNKFFEAIIAGLAVFTGPSPAMSELVLRHGFGRVSSDFDVNSFVKLLNDTTYEDLLSMKQCSNDAQSYFCGEAEQTRCSKIWNSVLGC